MKVKSPLTGLEVEVKTVREHPQFPGKQIVEDLNDGYQFTHPLPTPEELAKVYGEDYNAMYGRDPSKIPTFVKRRAVAQLDFIQKHMGEERLAKCTTVGEAGAGWGELSRVVAERLPNARVVTYELDHDSVKSMKDLGLDARYGLMEDEEKEESSYDMIMGSHVTEHFLDPRDFYQKVRPLLKPDGYLFIEIPLENPIPNHWGINPDKPYWVGHLHYFAVGHLEKLLESLDYKILAKSCHDHPFSPGVAMPGTQLYEVDKVPVEEDSKESTSEFPVSLRILACKK